MKRKKVKMLYLAYGSNVNPANMAIRCRRAKSLGIIYLRGYELIFQGVANLRPKKNRGVYCVLWGITPSCEKSLDWYEEYPRLYGKRFIRSSHFGESLMVYVLRYPLLRRYPAETYVKSIETGYTSFGIPKSQLTSALERSVRGNPTRVASMRNQYTI